MYRQEKSKIQAIAFAGCSFTWGQGLWYYSALDSCAINMHYGYDPSCLNIVHHLFREKWRWCNLVADHFNTVALTHPENGGANDQILEFWKKSFVAHNKATSVKAFDNDRFADKTRPINLKDVGHFVFQLTQWWRSSIVIEGQDGMPLHVPVQKCWQNFDESFELFNTWFSKNHDRYKNNVGTFHNEIMYRDLIAIKNFLTYLESNGIKTYVVSWPKEFVTRLKADSWFTERLITFNHNQKQYDCMEDLLSTEKLTIEQDTDFFEDPPKDQHPSLAAQKIIANNVIAAIEKRNG